MAKYTIYIVLITAFVCGTVGAQQGGLNDNIIRAHAQAITARDAAIQNPTLENLTHAADLFDTVCAGIADNDYEHQIYYEYSRFAQAWLLFHLAELTADYQYLSRAYNAFQNVANRCGNETIGVEALYMAGESKLREAILRTYSSLYHNSYSSADADTVERLCREAKDIFESVAKARAIMPYLDSLATLRQADAVYHEGRSAEIARRYDDATALFNSISYSGVQLPSDAVWADIKNYSEAMRKLHLFICSPDQLSPATAIAPPRETNFRQGNVAHVRGLRLLAVPDSQKVAEGVLTNTDTLYYQNAVAGGTAEADYWQGYIEFFLKQDEAFESFKNFSDAPGDTVNLRLRKLKEDARLKALLADTSAATIGSSVIDSILNTGGGTPEQRMVRGISIAEYLIQKANYAYFNPQYQDYYPIYWNKSLAFLESVCPQGSNSELCHKATFLKGIIHRLAADTVANYSTKAQEYFNAAHIFNSVGGSYATEGQYARAVCLIEGWGWDSTNFSDTIRIVARDSLRSLIQNKQSLRAYYRMANSYRGQNDTPTREYAFRIVRQKAGGDNDFNFLINLAEGDTTVMAGPSQHPLALIQTSSLQCPDYLIDDHEIFYEKVANRDVSLKIFLEESVDKLRKLMAPKLSLYPGEFIPAFTISPGQSTPQYAIYPDPSIPHFAVVPESFPDVTAGIPDIHRLDSTWNLKVCVEAWPDGQRVIPKPKITIPGLNPYFGNGNLTLTGIGCYEIQNIYGDSVLMLHVSDSDYYYAVYTLPGKRQTSLGRDVVLSKIVVYPTIDKIKKHRDLSPVRPDKDNDFLFITHIDTSATLPQALDSALKENINFRDFDYDTKNYHYLIIDRSLTTQIVSCDQSGAWAILDLKFDTASPNTFAEPEGIALDSKGNIYIADWGNHRIVIFDDSRNYVGEIGGLGSNRSPNSGQKAKVTFPTRLDIEEDIITGAAPTREKHLLVADRYGIHKFDMRGYYLDTPIPVDPSVHPNGSFYDFKIDGYGMTSTISMVDRRDGTVFIYTPAQ